MPKVLHLYNPPEIGVTDPKELAPLVDVFCMTPGVEDREVFARAMLAVNPKIEFHAYMLNHGVHWTDGQPNRNQILWNKGEPKAFVANYPKSPLRYPDGKMVFKNEKRDYIIMDTARAEWKFKMKERISVIANRARDIYKGVWYDDIGVEQRANAVGIIETLQYPTREAYFENFLKWLTYSREYVALGNSLRFGGNLQAPANLFEDFKRAAGIMLIGGGNVMIEWYMFNHEGELKKDNWLNSLKKAEYVTKYGGELWGIFQRDPRKLTNTDSREYYEYMFALYSHMLIDNKKSALRVAKDYSLFVDLPEIRGVDNDLGNATGDYHIRVDGWYERSFERQIVAVNPDTWKYALVDAPIIVQPPVDPPQPSKVKLSVTLEFEVPAAVASAVQAAFDSLDITVRAVTDEPA